MDKLQQKRLDDLRSLSTLLDSKFEIFGIRFGLDAIVGLIPGIGDVITGCLSFFIVIQAMRFGCGPGIVSRMGLNILVENLVEVIPFLGSFFDIFWRANDRNMKLFEQYLAQPQKVTFRSNIILIILLLTMVMLFIGTLLVAFKVIKLLLVFFGIIPA